MSVDVEIYMNNIIKFFRDNPNDLLNLIPKEKEEVFYKKIRETAFQNYDNGDEINLTQNQLINLCNEINGKKETVIETPIGNIFFKTLFGEICLN